MDLRTQILQAYTKANILKVVDYVGVNKERFKALVNVFIEGPYRVSQRAAWSLSYCVENDPTLIKPHLSKVLQVIKQPGTPNAVQRNVLRLLQFIDPPKKYHGDIIDLCFVYLSDPKEPVAVKVFAMTVLHQLIHNIPELQRELRIILEDQLPYAKPAFRSRAAKVLKALP